jgi:uncharacterized membrane protein YqaE (UPF0057 family)
MVGMSCGRVFLAIFLPPLAVLDKGCGSIVLVTFLFLMGWIPGILAALVIVSNGNQKTVYYVPTQQVQAARQQPRPTIPASKKPTSNGLIDQMQLIFDSIINEITQIVSSVFGIK